MFLVPQKIRQIKHPAIHQTFVKEVIRENGKRQKTLVIHLHDKKKNSGQFEDLLIDLPHIKAVIEQQVGRIDNIDITYPKKNNAQKLSDILKKDGTKKQNRAFA